LICNFGVVISIAACLGIDYASGVPSKKLNVPTDFSTTSGRPWFFVPQWKPIYIASAIPPALLCCVLMFLDQQITAVICNSKQYKLKKGHGYHLDLAIVALLMIPCACLGLPWYVAATVRSITHIQSLKKFDTVNTTPGQAPEFIGIIEQRGPGLLIFVLIGVSILAAPILKFIPLNILYGVFVLMGINAVLDLSLLERLLLFITPRKHHPDTKYLRKVDIKMVHLFTAIQIICLILLYFIKATKSISIAFPVMIVIIVIVRKLMEWVFSREELDALDN
jgi:hypothetical protein